MQSTRGRSLVWDPCGGQRFLTGGGSEIRLHQRDEDRIRTTSVVTELSGLRSFAWCPDAAQQAAAAPLVAAGMSSGKVLLMRMDDAAARTKDGQDAGAKPLGQLNSELPVCGVRLERWD